jgi:hypothetical protein
VGSVMAIPVFAWEVTLAVRLITKGFNSPLVTSKETSGRRVRVRP